MNLLIASKVKVGSKTHKKELEGLKDMDPKFFEFLKKSNPELLEFGNDMVRSIDPIVGSQIFDLN
jgi:hypothetical protein